MRIAVLGSGRVATALAKHWVAAGHDVVFGLRDASGSSPLPGASAASIAEAVRSVPVVLLAIPADAIEAVIHDLGEDLAGKTILDCSNGLSPVDHHLPLPDISGAEEIAGWAPGAIVVKVFNTTGFENLADPQVGGETATMFYATDDADAARLAEYLAAECGFEPLYAGPLAVARDLEWLTRFWGKLAFGQKLGRRIAFRLLRDT